MVKKYDLVIIGGGAAGFSAMVKYTELMEEENKIAIINYGPLGGTCVNVGCVPSKRLYHIAKNIHNIKEIDIPGIDVELGTPNLPEIMEDIRNLVNGMRRDKYEALLDKFDNVDLIVGKAYFKSANEVAIKNKDKEIIEGKNFIIATGSRPAIPNIPGIDSIEYHTSNTIWKIDRDIDSMLIIGSGAVGLELAQAFSRIGIKIYVVEVLDRIIPGTEPEISMEIARILKEEGIKLYLKSRISSLEKRNSGIEARIISHRGEEKVKADTLLVATGRKPNIDGLMLEKAGVKTDEGDRVYVDEYLKTTNPNIYAAGDVSSSRKPALLETISAREGAIVAENIVYGDKRIVDHSHIPVVVFLDPELAFVGATEEEVVKATGACQCRVVKFSMLAKSSIIDRDVGIAKLIVDPYTNIIMGFHVLAPNASEFISQAAIMLKHQYEVGEIIDMPSIFPTVSEIIKLSAQAFIRNIERMPCCME